MGQPSDWGAGISKLTRRCRGLVLPAAVLFGCARWWSLHQRRAHGTGPAAGARRVGGQGVWWKRLRLHRRAVGGHSVRSALGVPLGHGAFLFGELLEPRGDRLPECDLRVVQALYLRLRLWFGGQRRTAQRLHRRLCRYGVKFPFSAVFAVAFYLVTISLTCPALLRTGFVRILLHRLRPGLLRGRGLVCCGLCLQHHGLDFNRFSGAPQPTGERVHRHKVHLVLAVRVGEHAAECFIQLYRTAVVRPQEQAPLVVVVGVDVVPDHGPPP